jgi:hypothetical protein
VEDRVSGLEDKINIKEKTEEYIEKDWRVVKGMCKNSVTPSNLWIMSIKEREEVHAKGIENITKKTIVERQD